jgi:hypothetical protein
VIRSLINVVARATRSVHPDRSALRLADGGTEKFRYSHLGLGENNRAQPGTIGALTTHEMPFAAIVTPAVFLSVACTLCDVCG